MPKPCDLVLIFGPPAVGKMTVGHALAELTGYKLFHNHMSIELALPFFDYGTAPFQRLVQLFREQIFAEAIAAPLPGLIFTWVWAFDLPQDSAYIQQLTASFASAGGRRLYVELESDTNTLIARNQSPFRLEHKPSKRNLKASENNLLTSISTHRLNSSPEDQHLFAGLPYLKINNSQLSPQQVASQIQQAFQLPLQTV